MSPFFARLIVFVASFALMLVEVVSGRAIAPYLGVSVYSWTAVIGATLFGVTIGNYLGGRFADKMYSRKRLALVMVCCGFAVLLMNYLVPIAGEMLMPPYLPLWFKTSLFSLITFFPSAFLLSTITPQVAKSDIRALDTVGRHLGSLYAWSSFGSLVGTALAGYVLIALVGTKVLLTLTSVLLFALGLAIAWPEPIWKQKFSVVIVLFFVGDLLVPGICNTETSYYCVRVSQQEMSGSSAYILRLDHLIHTYVKPQKPEDVGYGYERVYTNLIAYTYQKTDAFNALFIGGGGYALPRYLEAFYPSSEVTVSEIDPGVTEANHTLMELPRNTRIQTVNKDARVYLDHVDAGKTFDLVFGDAFNDFSVPYHLTTVEFHRVLKQRMSEKGVYAMNIIDDAKYGDFLAAMTRTLQSVWKNVYVAPGEADIKAGRNTIVLLATDLDLDLERWKQIPPQRTLATEEERTDWQTTIQILPQEKVETFLASHKAPALTDNFVPTDRYLAPVFSDAY
ncbi:MAG: fused MFS/spermidine synthase [Patescibacteria group bacterium]